MHTPQPAGGPGGPAAVPLPLLVPILSAAAQEPPRAARRTAAADMQPCRLCGRTHPRRMYALMTHWYGRFVGLPDDHGYFYLCPRCHAVHVRPREARAPRQP